jgi:hypothetical protein
VWSRILTVCAARLRRACNALSLSPSRPSHSSAACVGWPGARKCRTRREFWSDAGWALRGGSFAAPPRLLRRTWRNFYKPERADMFCGFRTCAI